MIYVQFSNHLITFFDGGLEKNILVIVTDFKNQLLFMGLGFRVWKSLNPKPLILKFWMR